MSDSPPLSPAGHLDPGPLMQLSTAYWGSQTLLTANRIGLFEQLAGGAKRSEQVAADLGTQPRETLLLLKCCVAQYALSSFRFRMVRKRPSPLGTINKFEKYSLGS